MRAKLGVVVSLGGCAFAFSIARAQEAADPLVSGALPGDLSPWTMFETADTLVKGVMILLVAASALTWTIALAKGVDVVLGAGKLKSQTRRMGNCGDMAQVAQALDDLGGLESAARGAVEEIAASLQLPNAGIKERIASRLDRLEADAARRFGRATGVLATIGATAPFIGLFGTVWGVMNSFIGIARHHTTNLAVIAPGLAEALLTTALGLATAIPAVVFYNLLARGIGLARARYADGAAVILRTAGRDLDRGQTGAARAAAE